MQIDIQSLIYIHAGLGGIALISGFVAAISTKGSKIHKKAGATFHHSMLASIFISLIVALSPDRFNPFLFSIGLFSAYFTIIGKRCLKVLKPNFNINIDKFLAVFMICLGVMMNLLPYIILKDLGYVLNVFGLMAIAAGITDLRLYRNIEYYKEQRIIIHINRICGGYIAAVTAFVVVNNFFSGYYAWFLPGILGSIYIYYWVRKEKNKKKLTAI